MSLLFCDLTTPLRFCIRGRMPYHIRLSVRYWQVNLGPEDAEKLVFQKFITAIMLEVYISER